MFLAQVASAPPEGGQVGLYTVLLAFIALVTLLGPTILGIIQTSANRAAKDREDAREEKRAERQKASDERVSKLEQGVQEVHTLTNANYSKIADELKASREETRISREETKELLKERAAAAAPLVAELPPGPIAVYTEPGATVDVSAPVDAPVPVVTQAKD